MIASGRGKFAKHSTAVVMDKPPPPVQNDNNLARNKPPPPLVQNDNNLARNKPPPPLVQNDKNVERENARLASAATRIQTRMRVFLCSKLIGKMKASIILIQSVIRGMIARRKKIYMAEAADRIKSLILARLLSRKFNKIRNAVAIIKNKVLGYMIQRLRYKRLMSSVQSLQYIAKGYLALSKPNKIWNAVLVLHRSFKIFSSKLQKRKCLIAATLRIQRVFRGHRLRGFYHGLMRVLEMRRQQRIATSVVKKLQSIWRGKLVSGRFQEVNRSTLVLQRWLRTRTERKKFLKIKKLTKWLQCHARRLIASRMVDVARAALMVHKERERLGDLYLKETRMSNVISGTRHLGNGYLKRGTYAFERQLLMADLFFDISIAYPDGWLPVMRKFCAGLQVSKIAIGAQHTLILDSTGKVHTMGLGDSGALGHSSSRANLAEPKPIERLRQIVSAVDNANTSIPSSMMKMVVTDISCGKDFSVLVTSNGKLFTWGDNRRGQLGHSKFQSTSVPRIVNYSSGGVKMHLQNVKQVACGAYHIACLCDPGVLYTWGNGVCLGVEYNPEDLKDLDADIFKKDMTRNTIDCCEPRQVMMPTKRHIFCVASGEAHVSVCTNDGVFSFGCNSYGQLGVGDFEDRRTLTKVPLNISEAKLKQSALVCGGRHVLLRAKESIWLWGWNKFGQIGNGSTNNVCQPISIQYKNYDVGSGNSKKGESVVSAILGWRSTIIATASGSLLSWGVVNREESISEDKESLFRIQSLPVPLQAPGNAPINILADYNLFQACNSSTMSIIMIDKVIVSKAPSLEEQTATSVASSAAKPSGKAVSSSSLTGEFKNDSAIEPRYASIHRKTSTSIDVANRFRQEVGRLSINPKVKPKKPDDKQQTSNASSNNAEKPASNPATAGGRPKPESNRDSGVDRDELLRLFSPLQYSKIKESRARASEPVVPSPSKSDTTSLQTFLKKTNSAENNSPVRMKALNRNGSPLKPAPSSNHSINNASKDEAANKPFRKQMIELGYLKRKENSKVSPERKQYSRGESKSFDARVSSVEYLQKLKQQMGTSYL